MLIVVVLCCVVVSDAGHVLVVFSTPENSHSVLGDSLVDTLLEADYEVTYVTPFPTQTRRNLTYVDVSSILDQLHDEGHPYKADLPEDISSPRYLPLLGTGFAQQVLKHPDVQELMFNSTLQVDAVLVEWLHTGLLAPLSSLFECPLMWYSPAGVSWQSLSLMTATPAQRLDLPASSLADRLHLLWTQVYLSLWNYFYISKIEIPAYEKCYRAAFQDRRRVLPNYEAAVAGGALLVLESHALLAPALSLPGNVKYIGGHHIAAEVPPLPKNLKKLLDSSAAGVIYVNLETNLIDKTRQEHVARELKDVFGDLEQTVVWKYDDILVNLAHNVYTMKNPPQHSILNHVNTIAFINHGDMFSILDATHYGVPVAALPLLEDHEVNVNTMVRRGCGVRMGIRNLSWEIRKSVKAILNNDSYRMNAKKVRSTFCLRVAPPRQEFLHHVHTVIRTDGATHLRSTTLDTTFLEMYNVDVMLLALMMLWLLTKVVRVVRVHLDSEHHEEDHEKED